MIGRAFLLAAVIAVAAPGVAMAQEGGETFTVTATADGNDGVCSPTPDGCTLREAIAVAGDGDIVFVPPGTYRVTTGELDLAGDNFIAGGGARTTIIDAETLSRVGYVHGGTTLITGVTLAGGNGVGQVDSGNGGALNVAADGVLALLNSTVVDNDASGFGGGISTAGQLTIGNSTISGNTAINASGPAGGAGIFSSTTGATAIITSTVSGNVSSGQGGGIHASGFLELNFTTITANTASSTGGGGLYRSLATEASSLIYNTIVAGNSGDECAGNPGTAPGFAGDHNLSDDATCGFTDTGDQQNANPLLGTLANNGGPTATHALGAGSPAIDAAHPDLCGGVDQRGAERAGACDIGSYETGSAPPSSPPPPPPPPPPPAVSSNQELPPPEPGESVNAEPAEGTVKIKLPGTNRFVVLGEGEQIPVGTTVDATKGRVRLVAAADKSGGTVTADFYEGIFKIGQTKDAKPITTLKLVEKLSCGKGAGKAGAAAKKKKKRHLWGDGKGTFRTDGSYSSATVRGTRWLTQDTCTSTLTKVVRGKVAVRDFVKRKTVLVKAGKQYVAKRKA